MPWSCCELIPQIRLVLPALAAMGGLLMRRRASGDGFACDDRLVFMFEMRFWFGDALAVVNRSGDGVLSVCCLSQ